MTSPTTDTLKEFGPTFQSQVIVSLMKNAGFLAQSMDVITSDFFDSDASKWIINKIVDYYTQYKKPPTLAYFRAEVSELSKNESLKVAVLEQLRSSHSHFTDTDLTYVQERFLEFCKNQTLKNAILRSADLLKLGRYGDIKAMIDTAMKAGTQKDIGLIWSDDFDVRHAENARDTVATGWAALDRHLDGGLGPGELGCIMAPSGIGKSWALTHLGKTSLLAGKNVLHYTYELNQNYQGVRYDTSISGIEPAEIKNHLEEVRSIVATVPGNLVVKYFPSRTANVHTLEAHIDYLQMIEFIPDVIIVDYADLMRSNGKAEARYQELGYIYEELRSLAGELQVPLWTASQTQRSSHNDDIIEADKVAESYDKVKTSDVLLSISRKTEDKINNTGRAHLIKNRFGPDGVTFPMRMDTSKGIVEMHDGASSEGELLKKEMTNGEESVKKTLLNKLQAFEDEADNVLLDTDPAYAKSLGIEK
jgi:replicative DNA helicase